VASAETVLSSLISIGCYIDVQLQLNIKCSTTIKCSGCVW